MTLTRSDLAEFRRREKETGALTLPPANFLKDLKTLMDAKKEEAGGPHPATWPEDAEIFAIMERVEGIFRIRRGKLARVAELNPNEDTTPTPKQMLEFESCAWFGLTATYRHLDNVLRDITIKGEWSGKWGELPKKGGRS